jgi:hypothetical protein
MSQIVFPDYDHSILNITSSILKHYGVDFGYQTIKQLDQRLEKNPRNVIYILVDALGSEIIKKHPLKADFLISNQKEVLTTVFPSTTTSATVTAMTGLPPIRTAWIGWQQFVKEEGRHVIFFQNKDYYDEDYHFEYNIADKFVRRTNHYDLIKEKNPDVQVHEIFPKFRQKEHDSMEKQVDTCLSLIDDKDKHFVYIYWDQVDSKLHEFGTTSKEVNEEIGSVNNALKRLFDLVDDDTLIVVTADHGHIDIESKPILQYEDVAFMLKEKPALEARCTAFYVKDEYKEAFPEAFDRHFREHFVLYQSEDLLKMKIFGPGKPHPRFREYLGDYVSIAIDRYAFGLLDKKPHKSTHAGLTKDEMLIPLIMND